MSTDKIKVDVYWRMVPDYVWAHDDTTPTDVVVWCALLTWADAEHRAFPSQASIARRAGVSRSTVARSLERLRDAGAITSEPHDSSDVLVYTMHMLPPSHRGGVSPVTQGGVSNMTQGGVSSVTHRTKSQGNSEKPLSSGDDAEDVEPYTMSHAEAFDTLALACGYDAEAVRQVGGGLIGKAAKDIRELRVTQAEVLRRAERYQTDHPDWELTPASLLKWWPTLDKAPKASGDRRPRPPVIHDDDGPTVKTPMPDDIRERINR